MTFIGVTTGAVPPENLHGPTKRLPQPAMYVIINRNCSVQNDIFECLRGTL